MVARRIGNDGAPGGHPQLKGTIMSKFVLLYMSDTPAAEQMQQSEEEGAADMQEWTAWAASAGGALLDFGLPLGNARSVSASGSGESSSTVGGYSIIEAADADAAAALLAGHPHLKNGTIELLEAFEIPGM